MGGGAPPPAPPHGPIVRLAGYTPLTRNPQQRNWGKEGASRHMLQTSNIKHKKIKQRICTRTHHCASPSNLEHPPPRCEDKGARQEAYSIHAILPRAEGGRVRGGEGGSAPGRCRRGECPRAPPWGILTPRVPGSWGVRTMTGKHRAAWGWGAG